MTHLILKMSTLLLVLITAHEISAFELHSFIIKPRYEHALSVTENLQNIPNLSDRDYEYLHQIYSMIDAYKRNLNSKVFVETNELINTKYQTWKRNGDLVNSLLALPKGLMNAGR